MEEWIREDMAYFDEQVIDVGVMAEVYYELRAHEQKYGRMFTLVWPFMGPDPSLFESARTLAESHYDTIEIAVIDHAWQRFDAESGE